MPKRANQSGIQVVDVSGGTGCASLREAVAEDLRRVIREGQVAPGDLIPPERELADLYGVCRPTVRQALVRLTRRGILRRIPGVGYSVLRADMTAMNARAVGLIVGGDTTARGTHFEGVLEIEKRLAEAGRVLVVTASGLTAGGEDDCIGRLNASGVVGLIVTPAMHGARSTELETWIRHGRPIVLEGHAGPWLLPDDLARQCDQVDVDNHGGVRQVLDHLVGLGHARFGVVATGSPEGSERFAAFASYIEGRGLPQRHDWVVKHVSSGREGGREGFARLRAAGEMPTAVFCPSDDVALGVIDAARAAGVAVPGDLSVAGFGNESVDGPAALAELSTAGWSHADVAREIVRLLSARMDGRAAAPECVRVPVHVVPRASTGPIGVAQAASGAGIGGA